MTPEELEKRQHRAETEPMIISRMGDDFRVHSPGRTTRPYVVSDLEDGATCTCADFEKHSHDPEWRCKHLLAVLNRLNLQGRPRPASEAPAKTAPGATNDPAENGRVQMLLKRSVSPDGRIDSLSVEFSCPVDGELLTDDVEGGAGRILDLQERIVDRFLNGNGRADEEETEEGGEEDSSDEAIPAELVAIRGVDGKWGRRLYITVRTDEGYLRLYGGKTKLAEHLTTAGYPGWAGNVREGVKLGLACRIVTRPSGNSGFINIEEVLPPASRRSRGQ